MDKQIEVRAKFFTRSKVETRKVIVEADGTIRVWDEIANIFTICHALSKSEQRRIVRLANASRN
jgi:hypothetical protein